MCSSDERRALGCAITVNRLPTNCLKSPSKIFATPFPIQITCSGLTQNDQVFICQVGKISNLENRNGVRLAEARPSSRKSLLDNTANKPSPKPFFFVPSPPPSFLQQPIWRYMRSVRSSKVCRVPCSLSSYYLLN
jgi:hypothetical protein